MSSITLMYQTNVNSFWLKPSVDSSLSTINSLYTVVMYMYMLFHNCLFCCLFYLSSSSRVSQHNNTQERIYDAYLKKKKKKKLAYSSVWRRNLNVYVYTLAEFLCSICWTNDAVNKIKNKNELFVYIDGVFFSSLRIVYVSSFSFSHHAIHRAVKKIFSGILSHSSKVDQIRKMCLY